MKNFIKNNLKVFVAVIISAILFTGIGVYAASVYLAKDISFTPTNENFKKENGESINNVEDALNELYDKTKNDINEYTGEFYISASYQANYARLSYFDINTQNYNNVEINITNLFSDNVSVFTSYILADNVKVYDINKIGKISLDVKNINNIRIYYYENEGYYYLKGEYRLY